MPLDCTSYRLNMFRALLWPSLGSRDCNVDYHIGRFVLGFLYVGGYLRLGRSSVRVQPGHSLTPGRYNPCRVLADSRSLLQPSLSLPLILQFLTPSLSASLFTPSIHMKFGLPTRLLPSDLSEVIYLHGRLSCIPTIRPAHLSLVILIVVTKSVSSNRRYSSSLYLDLHITPSQISP